MDLNAKFNPAFPIVAVHMDEVIHILAYAGRVKRMHGQCLYCIVTKYPKEFKWFSWNDIGTFLIVAHKSHHKSLILEFKICKNLVIFYHILSFL